MQGFNPSGNFPSTVQSISDSRNFFLAAQALSRIHPNKRKLTGPAQERKHVRQCRSLSISVQPLDDSLERDGEMFWVVSRDISIKGIGLLSNDPIEHTYVTLGLLDNSLTVTGAIRHNTSIGSTYPLYLVGIEFLQEF